MKRMFLVGAVLGLALAGGVGLLLERTVPAPEPQPPQLHLLRPGESLEAGERSPRGAVLRGAPGREGPVRAVQSPTLPSP